MNKTIKAKLDIYERYPSERSVSDQYTKYNRLRWKRKVKEVRFEFLKRQKNKNKEIQVQKQIYRNKEGG